MGLFLLAGAVLRRLEGPALWVSGIYLGGVALGRAASLLLDGLPPLGTLVVFGLIEAAMSGLSFYFLHEKAADD
jgi:hypothetical protein